MFLRGTTSPPAYHILIGPTLVLAAYGTTHVSPHHLVRPLAVATIIGVTLGLVTLATRRRHVAAVVSALSLLAVAGFGELFGALLIAWLFLRLRARIWRRSDDPSAMLTPAMNLLVAAWFAISATTALIVSIPPDIESDLVSVDPGRNVYLILLDAYPRHDSLVDYFEFDNSEFLDALEDRDFHVAADSGTPYVATIQVVPSMFQMRSVDQLLGTSDWDELNMTDAHHRRLWHMLNAAPIFDAFSAAGYTTISITSSAEDLDWRSADVVMESDWPTRFEDHLIGRGPLGWVLPFAAMDRAELLDSFRHLKSAAGTSPRFVFAHFMAPHDPYVFTADGGPAAACGTACTNHAGPPNPLLKDRFLGHLQWTNASALDAIDHIVSVDPTAVVIVFSDHGLRRDLADMDEWRRTLFAARGADFPDNVTPMAVFPTLLEADGP